MTRALLSSALVAPLAMGCGDPSSPEPSNGDVIAFAGLPSGLFDYSAEIYTVHVDGTGLIQLTDTPGAGANDSPSWSPDGRRIAFRSSRDSTPGIARSYRLYTMNADGSNQRRVSGALDDIVSGSGTSWSPDGRRIAYTCLREGRSAICVVNADGSGQMVLTPVKWTASLPAWSPDGSVIAFTGDSSSFSSGGPPRLWTISASGGQPRPLTLGFYVETGTSWSPDGSTVLCQGWRDIVSFTGGSEPMLMQANGTLRRPLISDAAIAQRLYGAVWSPDGRRVAAVTRTGATTIRLVTMRSDGSDTQPVISMSGIAMLAWRPELR